jgi:hypothetical protein
MASYSGSALASALTLQSLTMSVSSLSTGIFLPATDFHFVTKHCLKVQDWTY